MTPCDGESPSGDAPARSMDGQRHASALDSLEFQQRVKMNQV